MTPRRTTPCLLLPLLILLSPADAQDGRTQQQQQQQDPKERSQEKAKSQEKQKQKQKEQKEQEQKQTPAEWPKMTERQTDRVEVLLRTLKREGGEKAKPKCEAELVEIGLPCARRLFRAFRDNARNINPELQRVLDKIMLDEHAPLLAEQAQHKSVAARRYVIGRLARLGDKKWTKTLQAASKDQDDEVRFQAAIGLVTTTQDEKALAVVFERCKKDWNELEDKISKALEPARGMEATMFLRKQLLGKTLQDKVTALRLMRSLAPKEAAGICKPYLDAEDSILKKEAINTLRVIVDGDKPLPLTELTVFQVIEQAKKWKARL